MLHSVALKTLIGFDIQFQSILFIALLVLYLAVRLVETKQIVIYPGKRLVKHL